jgi:hypothetical protein
MAGSTFSVLVDAHLNTATLRADLESMSKTGTLSVDMTQAQKGVNTMSESISGTQKKVKGLSGVLKDFGTTVGKVFKFAAATAAIGAVTTAVYSAGQAIKEYDAALIDYQKVSDLSGESLNKYAKHLGELGSSVARTRKPWCENV